MKKLAVLLIGILLCLHSYSQDQSFVLHPLVGDTIDRNEKLKYLLFQEINDSEFKYCTIKQSTEGYFVNVHTGNDSVIIQQIDSSEIRQTIVKLNKVMEYYSNQGKKDSIKNVKDKMLDLNKIPTTNVNNNILGEDAKERIFQEVRTTNRMKGDAERLENVKQGTDMFGGGGHIEFSKRRKKKN